MEASHGMNGRMWEKASQAEGTPGIKAVRGNSRTWGLAGAKMTRCGR